MNIGIWGMLYRFWHLKLWQIRLFISLSVLNDFDNERVPEMIASLILQTIAYYMFKSSTENWELKDVVLTNLGYVPPWLRYSYPVFRQMREVSNSGLKIVIALGGATHDNSRFDRMIANPATLRDFAQNTVLQLRQWGMDGIDVDWEFPSNKEIHLKFISVSIRILIFSHLDRCLAVLDCSLYWYKN